MRIKLVLVASLLLMCVGASAVLALGSNIERISVSDNGTQGNGQSYYPSLSVDGRYVAFDSWASNLVPNDTNGLHDIFIRDRQTNTTTLVSVSDNGTQGNGGSSAPSISGNGRYVAFSSFATNLVPNDTNDGTDAFIRDIQTNTTTRISITSAGTQADSGSQIYLAYSNGRNLSSDGRFVAFQSPASNLVPNDLNGCDDVFVRDQQLNTTTLVSIASDGAQGNAHSLNPSLSNDGRYVFFASFSSTLVPNDINGQPDVFVRDRQTNKTCIVSIAADGSQGNDTSQDPSMSGDGRYAAFDSISTNFVPNDTNVSMDVFVVAIPLCEDLIKNSTVASATGSGTITVSTSDGNIQSLTAVSLSELTYNGRPDNVSFPHGLLSFTITNIPPGSTVTITITYPAPIPQGVQYWKCQNGTWIDCTSLVGDDDGDEVLTLNITDGGLGDGDGQINGQITDPGGPVISVPAPVSAPHVSPALPRELNQTQISLQYLSVNPPQARVNQPLTIIGNVVNNGNQAGNYNLILKINGRVEQTRMVSVGPQGTQPVKFTITKAQPGTYAVDLGGQTGSFIIIGTGHNGSSPSKGGLLAILIICVMILATIVILLTSRRTA